MEKTTQIIFIIMGIFLVITLGFFLFSNNFLTGRVVGEYNSTHTQAICNETLKGNIYCEDYKVICNGGEPINTIATGFSVQHPKGWQDPRGENGSIITCE